MIKNRIAATTVLCLAMATSSQAQDRADIQQLENKLAAALNAGDGAAAAALYAEDAVLLPPGAPMVRGREAIEAFWTAQNDPDDTLTLSTVEVVGLGPDAAQEIGAFKAEWGGDEPGSVAGKYLIVWKKSDEGWTIGSDAWSFDG
ncbi:MAG: nuclear transport factor 2 family protein [Rhodobacteraceae bacterium]|nr:nuclear transport factor 2 family protein [Paracoccaceae bacterium]